MIELITTELKENKRIVIKGFGVFELLPRRKGKVNCYLKQAQGKSEPRYKYRIKFTPAKPLKEKICK
jgi:nucleoid DNA-binding protein